ncbi:hypothetical protein, partial [Amycolatopsis sp. SID8362]|uniref:hypothetical protein n=1 Tax=Amycolatopsis sp. SID8362 TaxID=2690346 RepID=UPI00136DD58F
MNRLRFRGVFFVHVVLERFRGRVVRLRRWAVRHLGHGRRVVGLGVPRRLERVVPFHRVRPAPGDLAGV